MKSGIYCRKGDKGQTNLANKEQLSKSHCKIAAIGSIDELSAVFGLLMCYSPSCMTYGYEKTPDKKLYYSIQEDLLLIIQIINGIQDVEFDQERMAYLEEHVDAVSAKLKPLDNFILPGGNVDASWLYFARSICRRVERDLVAVHEFDNSIPALVLTYINRLSDLLFVQARKANKDGDSDVLFDREFPQKGV
jgi:cob(I)alamin adenosyltransferase